MKKTLSILSLLLIFAATTFAGPINEERVGTIKYVFANAKDNTSTAMVIDNTNNQTYAILLIENTHVNAIPSNAGATIIFRLFNAGNPQGHDGHQMIKPIKMQ